MVDPFRPKLAQQVKGQSTGIVGGVRASLGFRGFNVLVHGAAHKTQEAWPAFRRQALVQRLQTSIYEYAGF